MLEVYIFDHSSYNIRILTQCRHWRESVVGLIGIEQQDDSLRSSNSRASPQVTYIANKGYSYDIVNDRDHFEGVRTRVLLIRINLTEQGGY